MSPGVPGAAIADRILGNCGIPHRGPGRRQTPPTWMTLDFDLLLDGCVWRHAFPPPRLASSVVTCPAADTWPGARAPSSLGMT
ncbi:hypothetical protein BaRGS_00005983 [Batillaria attramentaria]|uniref:Uncharacterized protein n=1 Tax=Batillaria attramentaria TaxID=370345 RepID=A0ABD0LTN2_9CAEN